MATTVFLLGSKANRTNSDLVRAWRSLGVRAELVAPAEAARRMAADDVALARLDVLPTLDGVEPGLLQVLWLERSRARVFNRVAALLGAHDKLRTARLLERAGLPHPRTVHLRAEEAAVLEPPLVVKPRFGSWGRDVFRCQTGADLGRVLALVRERRWFRRQGAVVQELVPPRGHDLRVLVAGGRVVGAAERLAAPGEWRTNVSLGGTLRPVEPPPEACALALAAVEAVGGDFLGVDLLPCDGGHVVLELNGAVELNALYGLGGGDVYCAIAEALALAPLRPRSTVTA